VNYIGAFEQTLSAEAHRHKVDGVICGHIHHAVMHDDFGIRYMNCGDWVESCTALVEHADGRFEIINWSDHEGALRPLPDSGVAPFDDDAEIAA
jgi:UDP-2,3-diacylglucosamine pyrophosphatase LpxH